MICENCGYDVDEYEMECSRCGAKLNRKINSIKRGIRE